MMSVDERARRQLQEELVGAIGEDSTDTLMGYLPPVGWADVATKQDLHSLETVLRTEFQATLHRELRIQFYWITTLMALLFAAFVAALELI